MFDDFKKAVLNSYRDRKAKNMLSDNLINPTRVKLKNECLNILIKRYDKKDDQTIKDFFDPTNKFSSHEQSIMNFDLDGFQALITFFKRNINIRKEENIKFLAWLINFEPRPYKFEQTYSDIKTIPEHEKLIEVVDITHEPIIVDEPVLPNTRMPWKKIGIVSFFSILFLALSTYFYPTLAGKEGKEVAKETNTLVSYDEPDNSSVGDNAEKTYLKNPKSLNGKQCMYWTGEYYEAVACDQKIDGAFIIALDNQKLNQLKRITVPDTLNKKDLGKTWYVKINKDSVEFYTDSGDYPLDSKRRLKPLTAYILNKYPKGYNIYKQ